MTALITSAWHITKKDLLALRQLIAMSVVLTLLQTLLRTVWPPLTMALDPDLTQWLEPLRTTLPILRPLLFALIVTLLVHADPLVSADAFWLTRPISRPVLFVSKLLTMLLVLALPAALAQVAPMIAFGLPPLDLMRLLSENVLYFAAGLMGVFAAAALTPNPRSLVAWAAGFSILWAGAAILMSGAPIERRSADGTKMHELRTIGRPAPAQVVTSLVLIATGCGVAAWYQYRTRRRERSALIAAATAGAVLVMPYFFTPVKLEARVASFTEEPPVALGSGMRFQDGPRSVVMWPLGDRDGMCGVMVRLTQVQGIKWMTATHPRLTYQFVHRPTQQPVAFTYYALPDRSRELDSILVSSTSEDLELFQVLYRNIVLSPVLTPANPADGEPRLTNVACRDVDVVVRH